MESNYPRLGERIAPALLREILLTPLPPALAEATSGRYHVLADLDETVWQHATPEVCRSLAEAVARRIQPKLRYLPPAIYQHPLPRLALGTTLAGLRIGVRTYNCLRLLCGDVTRLAKWKIGDLPQLRGMGVRSFLDILCALEAHAAIGQAPAQLHFEGIATQAEALPSAGAEELPCHLEVEITRYPRVGQRLAPRTLAPLLNTPVKSPRIFTLRFKDLDESVWERFSPDICLKLSKEVVALVKTSPSTLVKVGGAVLPMPRTNGAPLLIQLEQRTFNCLKALDLLRNPRGLASMTVGDFLHKPGFGSRCLVDLLSALESHMHALFPTTPEVRVAVQSMIRIRGVELIADDDPRFGLEVQSLMGEGKTLKLVAEHVLAATTCPMAPKLYVRRFERLQRRVRSAKKLSLEEELADLLCFEPKMRDREITLAHLGWNGEVPRTFEEVGHEFGMTRGRAQQICQGHIDRLEGMRPYLPVLDRTLEAAAATIPCSKSRLEDILLAEHLTKNVFRLEGLLQAARVTSRACPFVLESVGEQAYAVPAIMQGVAKLVVELARKSISHWGVATVEDIAAQTSAVAGEEIPKQFTCSVLSAQHGFRWLDQTSGWFWLESTARNALMNQIEKILSACNRIHVSELRAGVSRHHRREGFAPPQRVLLELCSQSGWCRLEENFVAAARPIDHRALLSETEGTVVNVLKENGGILRRQQLEDLCIARGLKRSTFYIHLTYSPVIARYAPGVYGVRGAEIPPGLAESMVEIRRQTRVLADYGWLPNGRVFVSYNLSEGALSNGILSVPAGMKTYLQGEFRLLQIDGQPVGRLSVKDTQAWGLGPFFRRRGGEPGDFLQIVFDTKQRSASVTLGEPLEEPDT